MAVAMLALGVVVGAFISWVVLRWIGETGTPSMPDGDRSTTALVNVDPMAPEPSDREVLASAIDQLERSVIVVGADGQVVFRNSAATELTGTHVGVLLDSAVDELIVDARRTGRVERSLQLHGPPRASLLLKGRPVPDGSVVVIIEDVSERERIAKMRTDFVADISHELKTPVGAIAVLADALLDETDPDVVSRVATRIVDESGRAVTTIDDLLELSRIESAPVAFDVVDVHEVVQAAVARGRTVEEHKRVQLTAFDARESILIRADRRQLTSAVGNLVENAVKYSETEGMVQIRTRRDDRWIEVMVADQGVGIPSRDLDRVFERFYRVDRARSRSTGGTGLGLSIVRHVATNHGGEVQVSSTEGEGSTFVLRLPRSLAVDPSEQAGDDDPGADAAAPSTSDQAMSEGP